MPRTNLCIWRLVVPNYQQMHPTAMGLRWGHWLSWRNWWIYSKVRHWSIQSMQQRWILVCQRQLHHAALALRRRERLQRRFWWNTMPGTNLCIWRLFVPNYQQLHPTTMGLRWGQWLSWWYWWVCNTVRDWNNRIRKQSMRQPGVHVQQRGLHPPVMEMWRGPGLHWWLWWDSSGMW